MMNKLITILFVCLIAVCSDPAEVHAKSSAPVTFEYSVPENLKAGSEATTTIRVVSSVDLKLLEVYAAPYGGLDLLSGGERIVVTDLKKGEAGQIEVSIYLQNAYGYLAVYVSTTDAYGHVEHKNIAIRFGDVKTDAMQGTK